MTATATERIKNDIIKILGMTNTILFQDTFNRPNLFYSVKDKLNDDPY